MIKVLMVLFSACAILLGSDLISAEKTFAMIKPDAVTGHKVGHIVARIEEEGFEIKAMKMIQMTKEQATEFYGALKDQPFFPELVRDMTASPVVVMVIEGENAIERYRKLMGATDPMKASPGTLRGDFGLNVGKNAVHGSDSQETAVQEINFFFGSNEIHSRE